MAKQWKLCLFVGVWFISVLAALLLYGNEAIKPFDPDQKLATLAASLEFDDQLISLLTQQGVGPNTVVHITDTKPCFCDALSAQHQSSLKDVLSNSQYTYTTVVADTAFGALMSRYPAVAVVDEQLKLRYFGPYATGAGCWVGDDTVTTIARLATAPQSMGAVITSDVKGCYCPFSFI